MHPLASWRPALGARYLGEGRCRFLVWAPGREQVAVHVVAPAERVVPMTRQDEGYWQAVVEDIRPGARYFYQLDGRLDRPDPASRLQPEGVHGPSAVVDPAFAWQDDCWFGPPLQHYIIYELHIGAFTAEGTLDAAIRELPALRELGVTAVEIMPVAQFPGDRNWGYDGVGLFAVQNSYGGPEAFKRLVDACHREGLAVVLDVVYNHLGAEGNYLWDFGPYFTDRYKTGWGAAVNFDGAESHHVRRFFVENALHWLCDCHVDALRLDAVHAIFDLSAYTFLEQLADAVEEAQLEAGRRLYLIAESDQNDKRLVRPRTQHGYGMDAQWNDDFHHAVHVLLTGEEDGYYVDFTASTGQTPLEIVATTLREGFVYTGQYSHFRGRPHGSSARDIPSWRFVVCIQNHDQVGNRMQGERLSQLVSTARLKLGAALLLLSPYVPLLFMGEEYGETNAFHYFVSYTDPELAEAVRKGRREEFAAFTTHGEPLDPQGEGAFLAAKLDRNRADDGEHADLLAFYKALIALRKAQPALRHLSKDHLKVEVDPAAQTLVLQRRYGTDGVAVFFNFSAAPAAASATLAPGCWRCVLASAADQGPELLAAEGPTELTLPPETVLIYSKEGE